MTLSIAAKYPWGSLRKLSVFQHVLPQAIIFVTDSRWTKYYPNNQHDFEDVGTKFFSLTNDSGCVYSGDVQVGEQCVGVLSKKLKSTRPRSFKASMYTAQQAFQRVFRHHVKQRSTRVFPTWFLIGVCDKNGNASLMVFSSPKFKPIFIEGIYGIGVREAYKDFEKTLNEEIERVVDEEFNTRAKYPAIQSLQVPVQNNAEKVGMMTAAIMQTHIISIQKHETIGGPVQYAIITKGGISAPGISCTKDGTGATDTWHKVTPLPGEITVYQDKYKLGPDFINPSSFGLYCISE